MGAAVFAGIAERASAGMRELKFRAWHRQRKGMMLFTLGELHDSLIVKQEDGWYLEDCEIMQWTGLLDGDGNEIYEGDILRMADATARVVFWEKPPEFGLDFSHNEDRWSEDWNLSDDSERMEIIGTVYEHPELLR